jgi:heme/copper-type cytochrome/quinol oxidase subunit 4
MTVFISQFILLLVLMVTILVVAVIAGSIAGSLADRASSRLIEGAEAAAKAPPAPVDPKVRAARKAAYRQGLLVFVALAVLTAIEFAVAFATDGSPVLLFVLVLAKAGLIVQYYMHLRTAWSEEEAH